MSRPVLTRAIFAPVAIVIATTVVLPANPNFSQVNEWFTETLPATAASISLQTNDTFLRMGQASRLASKHVAETLLQTTAAISSETASNISRLGAWLANTPPPEIAALPSDGLTDGPLPRTEVTDQSKPEDKPVLADAAAPKAVSPTVTAAEPLPSPPVQKTVRQTPVKKSLPVEPPAQKLAALAPEPELPQPSTQPPLPEVQAVAAKAPVEQPAVARTPEVTKEPPAPVVEVPPAEEPKIARDDKPEEKQVFASLGSPVSVSDARMASADPVTIEAKIDHEYKPAPVQTEDRHIDLNSPALPSQASTIPTTSPLKLRALTRADIPPAEKFANLGSPAAQSDARTRSSLSGIVPPEQQRVAYDALPASEQPTSIGKRRYGYVADTKYTGLGAPEALLEALKHMGSNAKSLGLPASLWCADFMNMVLRKSGIEATGSRAARSYLKYGKQIDGPRVGAIAIFTRGKNGGHIGIVRGTDGSGNPIIVSGNHNNKVAEAIYPKARVIAYVVPR